MLRDRHDESPEFILPIDAIIRIAHALPVDTIDHVMKSRSSEMRTRIPQIREIWTRVQQVKTGKMAVYAVLVEEVCRQFLVCFSEGVSSVELSNRYMSTLFVRQLHY